MRLPIRAKHLIEKLQVEIPKGVMMISPASSSPLASPPDERDEQGSSEAESDTSLCLRSGVTPAC
jgi:hypothetical protein